MIEALKLFDPYNRQARLYPALLTLLPAIFSAIAWFPTLLVGTLAGTILSAFAICGGMYLLADLARSKGKQLEPGLLQAWDGWPSTRLLRHRDGDLPAASKARYCHTLSTKMGSQWPSAAEERLNPTVADDFYRSATDWLREQTRGPEYSRLLIENISYGFRRNLLGLRPVGLSLSAITLASTIIGLGHLSGWSFQEAADRLADGDLVAELAAAAATLTALLFWLISVRPVWVKRAGEEYARSLLASCDTLK